MKNTTDLDIAKSVEKENIKIIAKKAGIPEQYIEMYGNYKAKIDYKIFRDIKDKPNGKLILVTAISPTPAGEGKTTISVGLNDSLRSIGKNSILAIREPSLGPVFGIKGGAAGGGHAQVIPMEDINLHFTGDIHAISAANNLIAAMLDNHIQQGNSLNIDPRSITWKRSMDMNDRQLRNVIDGLGGRMSGVPREDGFEITAASEVMAVFCLSNSVEDLKNKLGDIVLGYNYSGKPVKVSDIKAQGAAAALLVDALKPNLVQTLEHNPAFVHGGPFANIAHGCNTVIATKMALKLADYVVTEAGFAADLGAEKFVDIKCRKAGLKPDACVLVATARALKYHGGIPKDELNIENLEALERGLPNLLQHLDNIKNVYGLPAVVVLNEFPTDTDEEIKLIEEKCKEKGVNVVLGKVWAEGGQGGQALAKEVIRLCEEEKNNFDFTYSLDISIVEKIRTIAKKVYRAKSVAINPKVQKEIERLEELGYGNLPVCIAKTQYSFSDDPKLLGAPDDFEITISQVKVSGGAGFIVVKTGDIMTMPGLPKIPAAENIDVDEKGNIIGLC